MDELTNNLQSGDTKNYRQWMDDLKRQREELKRAVAGEFEEEWKRRQAELKEQVIAKWTQGVESEEELERLLAEQHPGLEYIINNLKG